MNSAQPRHPLAYWARGWDGAMPLRGDELSHHPRSGKGHARGVKCGR